MARATIITKKGEAMTDNGDNKTVVGSSSKEDKKRSSTEKIWGSRVYQHGYAGVPSILIRGQERLGLSPTQFNIVVQLLDYWFEPGNKPFPTKRELAKRIGITAKTVQNNIRELEKAGLLSERSGAVRSVIGPATFTTWTG